MSVGLEVLLITAVAHAVFGLEPLPDNETLARLIEEWDNEAVVTAPCNNLPPGLRKMRHSFHAGYLDQLPLHVQRPDGMKGVVLDYTCSERRTWTNRHNNKRYDEPDQIANIQTLSRQITQFDSYVWRDYKEVKNEWAVNAGLSILPGIFSSSASYAELHQRITAEKRFVEDVTSFVSGFRADFKSPLMLQLTPGARQYIDRYLGNTYEASMDAYDSFVNFYGTHYYSYASFGGLVKMTMSTNKDLVFQLGANSAKANAEAMFKAFLFEIGASSSNVRVDARFRSNTQVIRRSFGGRGNLFDRNFYRNWLPTVADNPWLFSGRLLPLTALFPSAKRNGMERAIQVGLNKAKLDEMKMALNYYIRNLENIGVTNGDRWKSCSRSSPDKQCNNDPPTFVPIRCNIVGCRWNAWQTRRTQYIAEARAVFPRITAEERKRGRDDASVNRLWAQVERILLKMDTRAPLVSKHITMTSEVCYCMPLSQCTCLPDGRPMASVKTSQPFFSGM